MSASPSTRPICLLLLAAACGAPADDPGEREPELALEPDEVELGQVEQALGGSCGTQNTTFDRFVTATVVPDHFPPDSLATQLAATSLGMPLGGLACTAFGIANMGPTCDSHDSCYARAGASRSACDNAARSGWRRACTSTYDAVGAGDVALGFLTGGASSVEATAEQACRHTCLAMAEAMFQAVSSQGQDAFAAAQAETARLARERAIFSGAQPVRLHTLFTGNGKCFDVINDALDNRVTMNDCGNFSGQIWTISAGPVAGTFRLKSQFTGANRCLDIIGGQVSLGTCGNFSGQAWQFEESSITGFFQLKTLFTGEDTCLDLIGGVPTMVACGNFSGQFWSLE